MPPTQPSPSEGGGLGGGGHLEYILKFQISLTKILEQGFYGII
jgi:hypothetical protein